MGLDVFSRYVVGWVLAHRESASVARRLIDATVTREGIPPGQLTVHADRGAAMTSKPVAFLLADLGITKTQSRPHGSNDNPYSEAQFTTLKYHPSFPDRFGSCEDGRAHCAAFFPWYNTDHHHAGLGWHTPHEVHHGRLRGHPRAVRPARSHATRVANGGGDPRAPDPVRGAHWSRRAADRRAQASEDRRSAREWRPEYPPDGGSLINPSRIPLSV